MIPFEEDVTEEDIKKTERILEFYVGSFDGINEANKYKLIDMFTDSGKIRTSLIVNSKPNLDCVCDLGFRHGTYRMINSLVSRGLKVFAWILTHQGEHTTSDLLGLPPLGVCHSDELLYMFSPVFFDNYDIKGKTLNIRSSLPNQTSTSL